MSSKSDRRQILAAIALAELPMPNEIRFMMDCNVSIYFDCIADLHAWRPYFNITQNAVYTQPYIHETGSRANKKSTLANAYTHNNWRDKWSIHLNAIDPIDPIDTELSDKTRAQLARIAIDRVE